ncbi:tetraspanin-7-like [Prosopis cineraria]|uniref:tetraspanin-7-like n=1 Tax=Prosopis cineraria TaxID=364024 RepID=UPI00240F139A|nr:tetraspanin-7-like [Prosopis cineraria]XP_054793640.1 tetraspanin-7-like [Prosopis cineraria]XP_054820424.1 tetraspanin-7-like [Prosopis cineraria]
MFRFSNALLVCLNLLTFLFSIPILSMGIWLSKGATECEKWLDMPFILFGALLLVVSLAGLVGSCRRSSCLLWFYLVAMFVLVVCVFSFTVFTFAITNKGTAGVDSSGKGYKEYRLGDYSHWLQKRVNSSRNWNGIKSCLQSGELCSNYLSKYINDDFQKLYAEKLSPLQSGCCRPPSDCKFVNQSATVWNKTEGGNYRNPDCGAWGNDPKVLCFNCNSCKAGLLQNFNINWRKSAIIDIIFLFFLVIVYAIACCAFRNNRKDNWERSVLGSEESARD